jgi:hypothetical protein
LAHRGMPMLPAQDGKGLRREIDHGSSSST